MLECIELWLKAGILDGKEMVFPEKGSPQGSVCSPLLANVYVHEVLDTWFETVVQAHCRGKVVLYRYADDCAPRAQGRPKGPPERATVQPMRDGPSESACRSRFQTPSGCCGQKPW